MIDDNEMDERLVNSEVIDNMESNDISLRPRRISEFIGQPQVQKNLSTCRGDKCNRQRVVCMLRERGATEETDYL